MSGEGHGAPQRPNLLSEPHQLVGALKLRSQHSSAMDQQRRARQEIPKIYSEHAPPPVLQTALPGNRQASADIQDIITGIVKLFNGNINVAANTVRPLRPLQATRYQKSARYSDTLSTLNIHAHVILTTTLRLQD